MPPKSLEQKLSEVKGMTPEKYRELIPETTPWIDNDGNQTSIYKIRCDHCEPKKKVCERDTKSNSDVCVDCKRGKRSCLRRGISVADAQRAAARSELNGKGASGSKPTPTTPGPKKRKKAAEKDDPNDSDSGEKLEPPTPKRRRKATTPAPEAPPVNTKLREKPKSSADKPKNTAPINATTLKKLNLEQRQQSAAAKIAAAEIAKEKERAHQEFQADVANLITQAQKANGDDDTSSTSSAATTATKKKTPARAKPVSKAAAAKKAGGKAPAAKSAALISDSEQEPNDSDGEEEEEEEGKEDSDEDEDDEEEDTSQSAATAPTTPRLTSGTTTTTTASAAGAGKTTASTAGRKKKAAPEPYDPMQCISTVVAQIKEMTTPSKSLLVALSQDVEDQTSEKMKLVAELVKELNSISTRAIAFKQL